MIPSTFGSRIHCTPSQAVPIDSPFSSLHSDCRQILNLTGGKPRGGWKDIKSITLNELLDEFSAYALKVEISRRQITRRINTYYHIMDAYECATSQALRNRSAFVEGISRRLILQIEEIHGLRIPQMKMRNITLL